MAAILNLTARAATGAAGRFVDRLRGVSATPVTSPSPLLGWLVVAAGLAGLVGLTSLTGCSGIEPVAPYDKLITDPTQLYTRLRIDYRVLTLDTAAACQCATWQLTATPRDAQGGAMDSLPAPTFSPLSAADTTTVRVTADGRVTARQEGTTRILAELKVGNVYHADTAFIEVRNPIPVPTLASVSLDPLPPDSAIRSAPAGIVSGQTTFFTVFFGVFGGDVLWGTPLLQPRVLNTLGESITDLAFDFESLDPGIATIEPAPDWHTAIWRPIRPGQARLVVRTTAYGVTVEDTTVFTVTWPAYATVLAQPQPGAPATPVFEPQEVHIRPNGTVLWSTDLDRPIDVTFDDPTHVLEAPASVCTLMDDPTIVVSFFGFNPYGPAPNCGTGNLTLVPPPPPTPEGWALHDLTVKVRGFPVVGVYPYHDASTGATGRVVVE